GARGDNQQERHGLLSTPRRVPNESKTAVEVRGIPERLGNVRSGKAIAGCTDRRASICRAAKPDRHLVDASPISRVSIDRPALDLEVSAARLFRFWRLDDELDPCPVRGLSRLGYRSSGGGQWDASHKQNDNAECGSGCSIS